MTCTACWIPKVTNTHYVYVMLIAFPLQQTLHTHAWMLWYMYIACLALYSGAIRFSWKILFICNQIILVSYIFFVSPLQIFNQFTYFYETWCKYYIFGSHQAVIRLTSYSLQLYRHVNVCSKSDTSNTYCRVLKWFVVINFGKVFNSINEIFLYCVQ